MATVKAGGLAARHGLRIGDLILALDGRHLLSCSEPRLLCPSASKCFTLFYYLDEGGRGRLCIIPTSSPQPSRPQACFSCTSTAKFCVFSCAHTLKYLMRSLSSVTGGKRRWIYAYDLFLSRLSPIVDVRLVFLFFVELRLKVST